MAEALKAEGLDTVKMDGSYLEANYFLKVLQFIGVHVKEVHQHTI